MTAAPRLVEAHARTRPPKRRWLRHQTRFDRIVFDIGPNTAELLLIANPPVVTLCLPECFPRPSKQLIGLPGRNAFQRGCQTAWMDARCEQSVDMIRSSTDACNW
jgi:hypothetical protein